MRKVRSIVLTLAFLFSVNLLPYLALADASETAISADTLIAQTRSAMGSDKKLGANPSVSVTWKFTRTVPGRNVREEGEVRFDLLAPDKFLEAETRQLITGVGAVTTASVINRDDFFSKSSSNTPEAQVRTLPLDPSAAAHVESVIRNRLSQKFGIHLLETMIIGIPGLPIEFKYVGEAEAEDGRAHVVDARGPNGFAARIFLDSKTHLPLMVTYSENVPSLQITTKKGNVQAAPPKLNVRKVELRYSDFRSERGLVLPHNVSVTRNGLLVEERQLTRVELKPKFSSDHFSRR